LVELTFNLNDELFAAVVDVIPSIKQCSPFGIALDFEGFNMFLSIELLFKYQRSGCSATRFPDLPVEFFDLTFKPNLQVIGPCIKLSGLCVEEGRIPLGDGL